MSKKIKIGDKQVQKLIEQGLLPKKSIDIDGLVKKKDTSALAHHYAKSDEAGKSGIIKKATDTHGEVYANKIKIRAKGVLEEKDKPTVNETVSCSSGHIANKYNLDPKHSKDKVPFYPGGEIVEPDHEEKDMSEHKPKVKDKAKSINENLSGIPTKSKQADDGGIDEFGGGMDEEKINELSNDILFKATDQANNYHLDKYGTNGSTRGEKGKAFFEHVFRQYIGQVLPTLGKIKGVRAIGKADEGFRLLLQNNNESHITYFGDKYLTFYLWGADNDTISLLNNNPPTIPVTRKDANILWKIIKTFNPKTTILPSSFKIYGDHVTMDENIEADKKLKTKTKLPPDAFTKPQMSFKAKPLNEYEVEEGTFNIPDAEDKEPALPKHKEAYFAGRQAAKEPLPTNPYPSGDERREHWENGKHLGNRQLAKYYQNMDEGIQYDRDQTIYFEFREILDNYGEITAKDIAAVAHDYGIDSNVGEYRRIMEIAAQVIKDSKEGEVSRDDYNNSELKSKYGIEGDYNLNEIDDEFKENFSEKNPIYRDFCELYRKDGKIGTYDILSIVDKYQVDYGTGYYAAMAALRNLGSENQETPINENQLSIDQGFTFLPKEKINKNEPIEAQKPEIGLEFIKLITKDPSNIINLSVVGDNQINFQFGQCQFIIDIDRRIFEVTSKGGARFYFTAKMLGDEQFDNLLNTVQNVNLNETTATAGSNGSYSSKYFIAAPGHENKSLLMPGSVIVKPNRNKHTQGINAFTTTKGKLKESLNDPLGWTAFTQKDNQKNELQKFVQSMITRRGEINSISLDNKGNISFVYGEYFCYLYPKLELISCKKADNSGEITISTKQIGNELFSQLLACLQTGGTHLEENKNMKNIKESVKNVMNIIKEGYHSYPPMENEQSEDGMPAVSDDEQPGPDAEPEMNDDSENIDFDVVAAIVDYNSGEAGDEEILKLFSHLIKNGIYDKLDDDITQTGQTLMNDGVIDQDGAINMEKYHELVDTGQTNIGDGNQTQDDEATPMSPQDAIGGIGGDAGLNLNKDDADEFDKEVPEMDESSFNLPNEYDKYQDNDKKVASSYSSSDFIDDYNKKGGNTNNSIRSHINSTLKSKGVYHPQIHGVGPNKIKEDEMEETTGAGGSSGQFSGPLLRRRMPTDTVFQEDEFEKNDTNYTIGELYSILDGVKEDLGEDHEIIDYLYKAMLTEVMNGNLTKESPAPKELVDYFMKVIDSVSDNSEGNPDEEQGQTNATDIEQSGYNDVGHLQEEKISNAFTNLKKIRDANSTISKADMNDIKKRVLKAIKSKGIQFVEKVPEGQGPATKFQKADNTPQQDAINMIAKGQEDLRYDNQPDELFNKHFEDGINPIIKTPEITDQFGNKYPAQDHANVDQTSTLGTDLLKIIKKKKEALANPVPMYNKDPQPVRIVKEEENKDSEILVETDTYVITKDEQQRIDENINQMKKLFNYKPEKSISTKNCKTDNSLFKKK